jgi:AraC-like DNA-binding protein
VKSAPSLNNATPGVLLWPAAIIAWGPGYVSSLHKHHSAQLVLAIEGRLMIRGKSNHQRVECEAALVRPDATHEVDASGAKILIVLVDPESDLSAALTDKVTQDITLISQDTVARWREQLGDASSLTSAKVESWVRRALLSNRRKPRLHPKLYKALDVIRDDLGNNRRLSLKRLAAVAELSESRFMHVFTKSIGVPPRSYILWLRFQRACDELRRGANPTQAAHRAGFADGPHLTRTVRRMMGTTPVDLLRRRSAWGTAVTDDAPL